MKKNRKLATQNPSLNFRHFEEKKSPQKKKKHFAECARKP
jgi:hypothetical protein